MTETKAVDIKNDVKTDVKDITYLPSESVLTKFPEFRNFEIYGSKNKPLISVNAVAEMLGTKRIRLGDGYEQERDYVMCRCRARDGAVREQTMMTEAGLYRYIFRSTSEAAVRVQNFVIMVMHELFEHGSVTLADVSKKFEEHEKAMSTEIKTLKVALEKESKYTDEEHDKLAMQTRLTEKFHSKYLEVQKQLETLKLRLEAKNARESEGHKIEQFKAQYQRKLYLQPIPFDRAVKIVLKPDELQNYENAVDDDDEIHEEDDRVWKIGFTARGELGREYYVYVPWSKTLEDVDKRLHVAYQTTKKHHYVCSIADVVRELDDWI